MKPTAWIGSDGESFSFTEPPSKTYLGLAWWKPVYLKSDTNQLRQASELSEWLGVWIPITDSLPESGKPVLVACGKKVLRAAHAAKFALDEENWGWWNDGEGADYNEANDTTYWPEGWCEWNEHEEIHWQLDNEPTHWMPLPETPNV